MNEWGFGDAGEIFFNAYEATGRVAGAVQFGAPPISLSVSDIVRPEIKIASSCVDRLKVSSRGVEIETHVVSIGHFFRQ